MGHVWLVEIRVLVRTFYSENLTLKSAWEIIFIIFFTIIYNIYIPVVPFS